MPAAAQEVVAEILAPHFLLLAKPSMLCLVSGCLILMGQVQVPLC